MATYKVAEIEGIGPVYAEKLNAAGVNTTADLLARAATPKGRKELAEATGIDGSKILSWANMSDLFRVKGLGTQYTDLLHAAGVDTVKELRTRNAANLHAKVVEVNEEKNLVRQTPSLSQVEGYIEDAKTLDPVMEY